MNCWWIYTYTCMLICNWYKLMLLALLIFDWLLRYKSNDKFKTWMNIFRMGWRLWLWFSIFSLIERKYHRFRRSHSQHRDTIEKSKLSSVCVCRFMFHIYMTFLDYAFNIDLLIADCWAFEFFLLFSISKLFAWYPIIINAFNMNNFMHFDQKS